MFFNSTTSAKIFRYEIFVDLANFRSILHRMQK